MEDKWRILLRAVVEKVLRKKVVESDPIHWQNTRINVGPCVEKHNINK